MKKLLLSAIMATVFLLGTNAQTVITNDYGSPITGADGQDASQNKEEEKESFGAIGLMFYSFDGFENYGLFATHINPNGVGMDFALRANFKDHGNFNADILINYSFDLWSQNSNQLLLTLAAGPSLRTQDQLKGIDSRGKLEYDEGKFFVDCIINPRITVKFGKFVLTGGYFYWAPKFKFTKKDGATGGFNVGLGYDF